MQYLKKKSPRNRRAQWKCGFHDLEWALQKMEVVVLQGKGVK